MAKISALILLTLTVSAMGYLLEPKGETLVEDPATIGDHLKINGLSMEEAINVTSVTGHGNQKVYAGFVEVHPETGASIYFVFYEALQANPDEAPVMLWLQGGPGSSSWLGNLTEFGPYDMKVNEKGEHYAVRREVTWNTEYNLLFIDQPVGTGYSYVKHASDYVNDQDGVAKDLYTVLTHFFKTYSKYADNDFYVVGESFAGHYVPAITNHILIQNKTADFKLNLKAMAIGDGLTEMATQIATYAEFAVVNGLIDQAQYTKYKALQDAAITSISNGNFKAGSDGFNAVVSGIQEDAGGVNIYNIRVYGEYPDMITDYLNTDKVKEMYNVPKEIKFKASNGIVYQHLYENMSASLTDAVSAIVEQIPVLLYNGQNDFIVNTPGAEEWIRKMEWSGQQEYLEADRHIQKNKEGEVAYYYRQARNLMQVVVLDAGHMVPMDQPANCLEMLDQFVQWVDVKEDF